MFLYGCNLAPAAIFQDSSSCFSVADSTFCKKLICFGADCLGWVLNCVVQMRCNVVRYSNCLAYVSVGLCLQLDPVCLWNRFSECIKLCVLWSIERCLILYFLFGRQVSANAAQLLYLMMCHRIYSRWFAKLLKMKYNKKNNYKTVCDFI